MDSALAKFLQTMEIQKDVLTILFSDHGHKFSSSYLRDYFPESVTQTGHPFLVMILPENPDRYFTASELTAMEINQNRLATIRDLHHVLAKFSHQKVTKNRHTMTQNLYKKYFIKLRQKYHQLLVFWGNLTANYFWKIQPALRLQFPPRYGQFSSSFGTPPDLFTKFRYIGRKFELKRLFWD